MRMDPKLAARKQDHEVSYLGRKFRVRNSVVRRVLKRTGRSRAKANEALRRVAARERRERRQCR